MLKFKHVKVHLGIPGDQPLLCSSTGSSITTSTSTQYQTVRGLNYGQVGDCSAVVVDLLVLYPSKLLDSGWHICTTLTY